MAALKCFAIMPYHEPFEAVFQAVRQAASEAIPGEAVDCHWLKDVHAAGKITDDVVSSLHEATLCVADVTGNNANVVWETGYAMALNNPTILIGWDVANLPFDLLIHHVLPYDPGRLEALQEPLAEAMLLVTNFVTPEVI